MNPENEAAAVPCASVGADAGQPLSQKPELSIAEEKQNAMSRREISEKDRYAKADAPSE
jgi:hypothetical protein